MKRFILIFTTFILLTACSQSDSPNKISSSKVNRNITTKQEIQKPQSTTTSTVQKEQSSPNAQVKISDRMLLIEELNHLHFVYEPLDITFLYPIAWQQEQEEAMIIFYDEKRTRKITLSTDLFPAVDVEDIINIIVPKEFKEREREKFLTGPSGFYINGKMNNLILDYYIRKVPKKGFLILTFSYNEDAKDQMTSLSKQVIESIVYNYSIIQSQIANMPKKESTQ
jgi:hypothetical protein